MSEWPALDQEVATFTAEVSLLMVNTLILAPLMQIESCTFQKLAQSDDSQVGELACHVAL